MSHQQGFHELLTAVHANPIHVHLIPSHSNSLNFDIDVSYGVVPGDPKAYGDDAFVCSNEWRAFRQSEQRGLNIELNSTGLTGFTVAAFSLDKPAHDELLHIYAGSTGKCTSCSSEAMPLQSTAIASASLIVTNAVHKAGGWRVDPALFAGGGFYSAPGNRTHMTMYDDRLRRVGLHIDSFDRAASKDRHKAQNRICVNLGSGARAFIFCPLASIDIVAMLNLAAERTQDVAKNMDGHITRFMSSIREIPLVRIVLRPGQGYIAPTENLIHDASSFAMEDLTFTYRGRIISPGESGATSL